MKFIEMKKLKLLILFITVLQLVIGQGLKFDNMIMKDVSEL